MQDARDISATPNHGLETIPTDVLDILTPLRNNLILQKMGATVFTGLQGNIQIPDYTGTTVGWQGETECVTESGGTFTDKHYAPLRVCQILNISKQWLFQNTSHVENMLRENIVNQLCERTEKTLLSNDQAVSNVSPQGIFNLITPVNVSVWEETVALETALQTANYNGKYQYALSPYVQGALKNLPKDPGSGQFAIGTDGLLNGISVNTSNSVLNKGGVVGDWSNYHIYIWDGIDIVTDIYSLT